MCLLESVANEDEAKGAVVVFGAAEKSEVDEAVVVDGAGTAGVVEALNALNPLKPLNTLGLSESSDAAEATWPALVKAPKAF